MFWPRDELKMSEKIFFTTTEKMRLDDFLRKNLPEKIGELKNVELKNGELKNLEVSGAKNDLLKDEFSNSKIRRLIVSGSVFVNGRVVNRPAFELRGRSEITVNFDAQKFFFEKQPDDVKFEVTPESVLYEDENLIFINKPAFFPVEQTITGNRDNLHDAVVRFLWNRAPELRNPPYVGIMHRLDRETSGVILFTKNRGVNKVVSQMFQNHNFVKKYRAFVTADCGDGAGFSDGTVGRFADGAGGFKKGAVVGGRKKSGVKKLIPGQTFTVEKFMGRVSGKSQAGKWGSLPESRGGQYSKTDFTVLRRVTVEGKSCWEIECNLYTGRTHQIRVHLSEAGFPILGDTLYCGKSASRLYLHACELTANTEDLKFSVKSDFFSSQS